MKKISIVINTLNEEKNIGRAIASVSEIASEIIVVDMMSEDKTVEIAKKLGARVYSHKRMGYVEPARNFAISKATGDWIFILDADEEVSAGLRNKINELVGSSLADYYAVPRKNIIFGKWVKHSGWWPDYNIRLFKNGYVEWSSEIHSVPITSGRGVDAPAEERTAIVHHNYSTVSEYIDRLNRYSGIQAKELKKQGKKPNWKNLIRKPTSEFLRRYFAGKGYKDGVTGLTLALLQSLSEVAVEAKLWELHKFSEREIDVTEVTGEIKRQFSEINYWTANAMIEEGGGFVYKLKRKLKV